MNIDLGELNWPAIVVVAVGTFALGGGWYAALGKPWMALSGITMEQINATPRSQNMRGYGVAAVTGFLTTLSLAVLLQAAGAAGAVDGLVIGLIAGIGISALTHLPNYLFELRPFGLWVLNAGYPVVQMAVGGLVLGAWR